MYDYRNRPAPSAYVSISPVTRRAYAPMSLGQYNADPLYEGMQYGEADVTADRHGPGPTNPRHTAADEKIQVGSYSRRGLPVSGYYRRKPYPA